MTTELPAPKSRKESYLAKAAGEDVTIPEKPLSRTEQYLAAIAEGGGGGGGTSDFDQLTNRPKYNGSPMTGETNIPESTTYTAGDGIDIVAGVIKATNTGKARVLTTADYNWNSTASTATEPYDCVALWLLDDGVYSFTNFPINFNGVANWTKSWLAIVRKATLQTSPGDGSVLYMPTNEEAVLSREIATNGSRPTTSSTTVAPRIINNLTTAVAGYVLSANQGKVLNDKIEGRVITGAGAPATSTVGTVGMVYEDTTNGKLYICTAVTPGTDPDPDTYTWEEVGGDGITELTTADYNYPTDNPTSIALWLLDEGTYVVNDKGTTVSIKMTLTATRNVYRGIYIIGGPSGGRKQIVGFYNDDGVSKARFDSVTEDGTYLNGLDLYGPTVAQTTGTSTSSVMSQNAVTSMVFADPSARTAVQIGAHTSMGGSADNAVVIGNYANSNARNSVCLGSGARATQKGQMDISTVSADINGGYNNSRYRLLTGLYDGQSAHDAVNLGQLQNAIINGGTSAPTTTTVGAVGTQYTYVDTTGTPTAHLCVCTEIDTTDPSNPVYTWSTLI